MHRSNGSVWLIDWHSMKSVGNSMTPDGPGAVRPDFIVSDGDGTTADPAFTNTVVRILEALGYTVAVNDPYTGGTIVKRIGSPGRGVHSLQIEINRALYLDEETVRKNSGAEKLADSLSKFTAEIAQGIAGSQNRQ
jgi:N-formylglutamate deformylase